MKAAKERASREPSGSSQALADVAEEIHRAARTGDEVLTASTEGVGQAATQSCIRFEQLLERCAHPKWDLDPRMSVFGGTDNKKIGAEPFRTLRSRLFQIGGTRTLKRILVTSSVPAEGKTFVTANLARSVTRQPGRRVLAIDADLRASRLHLAFGAPSTPGLTEYLRGEVAECAIIQSGPDRNLCFIPGGAQASNPSELLLSERMKRLLDHVTPMFDFVILDSPPATVVHDPSLLADLCDGVLFVVKAGLTSFEVAEKAVAEFQGKNLLGVVLNAVERTAAYGQSYYHYASE